MRQSVANSRVNGCAFSGPLAANSGQECQQNQSDQDAAKAKKADLAVSQLEQLFKHPAPRSRRYQRQQPFNHQQQGQRLPKTVAVHRDYFLAGAAALPEPPELRMALKKSDDGSSTSTSLLRLKLAL
jgi:hypothetical protein